MSSKDMALALLITARELGEARKLEVWCREHLKISEAGEFADNTTHFYGVVRQIVEERERAWTQLVDKVRLSGINIK